MTDRACRFEKSIAPVPGLDVCVIHKSHSVLICDIGLAALRAENERLRTWPSDVMAALETENDALRAELKEAYDRLEAVLLERPYKDGDYTHLPYCNTSPKNAPGTPGVTCNCRVGAALRSELERVKKEYVDTSRALRKADDSEMAVGCLERENGELRAKLEAIAEWSPVSGRPCPLCTYREGEFLASCAWHRETGEQARVIAGLLEALLFVDSRLERMEIPFANECSAVVRQALSHKEA